MPRAVIGSLTGNRVSRESIAGVKVTTANNSGQFYTRWRVFHAAKLANKIVAFDHATLFRANFQCARSISRSSHYIFNFDKK